MAIDGDRTSDIRLMYSSIKLDPGDAKRTVEGNMETFHMIPFKIASLNLAQSQSVTVPISQHTFNSLYFRLSSFPEQIWSKNHLPQFHNARLVVTVEASFMIPTPFSLTAFSFEFCQKFNEVIQAKKPIQDDMNESIDGWEDWFHDDEYFQNREFETMSMIEMIKLEEKIFPSPFFANTRPWMKMFSRFEDHFKDLTPMTPTLLISPKMVLFDESLWSLSMRHDNRPTTEREIFESDEKGLTIALWRLDVVRDVAKYAKSPRIENMESITFEIQGDTCVEPIHVDVIINSLILERRIQKKMSFISSPNY